MRGSIHYIFNKETKKVEYINADMFKVRAEYEKLTDEEKAVRAIGMKWRNNMCG